MKRNKNALIALVTTIFMLLLAACGTGGQNAQDGGNANETPSNEDQPKETLIVGTDAAYAPFESMDKGQIVGFDVDILDAIMSEAGYEYELTNTGWEPLFQSVKNGDVQLGISAITITDERKETYDFSVPYFEASQMILVPEGSDVQAFADLKDKVVGVQTGTTGDIKAEELLGEKSSNIKKYETTPLAIMALINGEVEAVVADNGVVGSYVANNPDQPVVAISDNESFDPEFYGLMFQKGNTELRDEINAAINTILDNGTYTEIHKEWFSVEPDIERLKGQQ